MTALLAAVPITLILVLMLGAGWSAAGAGAVGAGAALLIGIVAFGFPGPGVGNLPLEQALVGTAGEVGFTAFTILWIIGPALGIHQLQLRTGAAGRLRTALGAVAPDPGILALLVAWFFVLFMEGAAGFGASVALAAPFLVGAGFTPVAAVTIALTGHVVGVSFGAIGTPIMPQVAVSGASGLELARATGIYHALLGWIPLIALMALVRREAETGHPRRMWMWTGLAYVCFVVPYTFFWSTVGPELPTLGGALFGGLAFVILVRLSGSRKRAPRAAGMEPAPGAGEILVAAAPYLVLVAIVLATRLVPPLRAATLSPELDWELYGVFGGAMQPLYHPGTMLLLGFCVGALLQRASLRDVVGAFTDATRKLVPVAAALATMLALSRLMVHAGMTDSLAAAAAEGAGSVWPALAPFVGVLGTFVTGSATASNILFSTFQSETAATLGLPEVEMLGAQGFGAAVGNMVCPHNVVAAGATVGLQGREGEILRSTLRVTLLYAGAGGALALLLVG